LNKILIDFEDFKRLLATACQVILMSSLCPVCHCIFLGGVFRLMLTKLDTRTICSTLSPRNGASVSGMKYVRNCTDVEAIAFLAVIHEPSGPRGETHNTSIRLSLQN
jgi:hypothetical protein